MTDQFQLLFLLLCYCFSLFFVQGIIFECKSTEPCGCSRNNVDIDARIVGGEAVAYRSWGWAVSVRDSSDQHRCGGTILSKDYILTAAHCFRKLSEESLPYSVAVGTDSLLSSSEQIRIVSQIIIHPEWNVKTKENDIAILQLDTSISMDDINVAKICLPEVNKFQQVQYPRIKSSLVAIGWGRTATEDIVSPEYLRQVTLETIDTSEPKCKEMIKNINSQFCAAVQGGGKGNKSPLFLRKNSIDYILDTCQGDSGGPIMQFSFTYRRWILTGIISYGYRCGLREYAGVYTRISVYIDWIKSIVHNDEIITIPQSQAMISRTSNINIIILLTLISLYLTFEKTINRSDFVLY